MELIEKFYQFFSIQSSRPHRLSNLVGASGYSRYKPSRFPFLSSEQANGHVRSVAPTYGDFWAVYAPFVAMW
ncbi:hypothetical protein GGC63_002032 [Paenibacillus sp. OAS669]|nr:hypothetical protein [Paenibacillus sp. OAS669]